MDEIAHAVRTYLSQKEKPLEVVFPCDAYSSCPFIALNPIKEGQFYASFQAGKRIHETFNDSAS